VGTADAGTQQRAPLAEIRDWLKILAEETSVDEGFASGLDGHPGKARRVAGDLGFQESLRQRGVVDITPDETGVLGRIEIRHAPDSRVSS
jgi:hypothetical protein